VLPLGIDISINFPAVERFESTTLPSIVWRNSALFKALLWGVAAVKVETGLIRIQVKTAMGFAAAQVEERLNQDATMVPWLMARNQKALSDLAMKDVQV
jgi:hypothetical protein